MLQLYSEKVPKDRASKTCTDVTVRVPRGFEPQAERFMETVVEWAGNVRDASVFGWQVANFERYWMQ